MECECCGKKTDINKIKPCSNRECTYKNICPKCYDNHFCIIE